MAETAGQKIIEGARDALAVAKGEHPAASVHIGGFTYYSKPGWLLIETAPHGRNVLLGWWHNGEWNMEVGPASWGTRTGAISNMSGHGSATHWMPLPSPPKE